VKNPVPSSSCCLRNERPPEQNDLNSSRQIPQLKLMISVSSWANAMCSGGVYHFQEFSVEELDALHLRMCHPCPVMNAALLELHLQFLGDLCCRID